MVDFERVYENEDVVDGLCAILRHLGATIELKGRRGLSHEDPVYVFNTKTGNYSLKGGSVVAKFPEVRQTLRQTYLSILLSVLKGRPKNASYSISFEINYDTYNHTTKVKASGPDKETGRIKEILSKIESEKGNESQSGGRNEESQKTKWEFKDPQTASETLFRVLEEMKVNYRIKPRSLDKQPEYVHESSTGRDYLIRGIVEVEDKGTSFELEGTFDRLNIYAIGDTKNMEFVKEVLKKVEPEKVKIEESTGKKAITRFGGKRVRISDYKWGDIGGLERTKDELREAMEWPLKNHEVFAYLGIRMPKGVLLHGPPGTGKTLLAKVIASEASAYFFQASAVELTSMWYGQAEKLVKQLFDCGREYTPSIIFIDEIDGLFTSRDKDMHEATRRMLGVFLQELDGLEELRGTVVLAATNRYTDLDPAMLRPGRFDRIIEIPLPDSRGREQIFRVHTRKMPITDVNFEELVRRTGGYSGADIESVCQRAGYRALRRYTEEKNVKIEDIRELLMKELRITTDDFEDALRSVKLTQA